MIIVIKAGFICLILKNSMQNLAREICDTNNQYNHQESTAASYIRPYKAGELRRKKVSELEI